MELNSLLPLLADGKFHSGSALGAKLGVSRTAIWKALNALSEINLNFESVKGLGYRIEGGLDLLDLCRINEALTQECCDLFDINLLLSVDSTNNWLIDTAHVSKKPYVVCLAELQSCGRGRRGRQWVSPFAKNLYLSIGFDLLGGVDVLNGLSLVIGIVVIRTLHSLGIPQAKLKWPNDVWVNDKKIAGILVELNGEPTTSWRVTVGIGLNVHMTESEGSEIDQAWTGVSHYLTCSRNELVAKLLIHFNEVLAVFKNEGFVAFMSEWEINDCLFGREISTGVPQLKGLASGVNEAGALLLQTKECLKVVNAGEVSVRPV